MEKQCLVASFIISSLLVPVLANAATTDETQAEMIQSLLSQITVLQQRLSGLTSTPSTVTTPPSHSCPSLNRTLSRGSRGTDVVYLQQFLIAQGSLAAGNDTGYFGPLTEAAVQQWQAQNSIISYGDAASTGYGTVGPKTHAAMNQSCAAVHTPGISPANSTASFTATPSSGMAPLTVSFSESYAYPTWYAGAHMLSIDFGDGTGGGSYTGGSPITAGNTVEHRYALPGTYTAKLMGCSLNTDLLCKPAAIGTVTITVTGSPAAAVGPSTFTAIPMSGNAPLTVHFSATDAVRYDPDGIYTIDFGDSNGNLIVVKAQCSSATCTISADHTYNSGGNFNPELSWREGCHGGPGGCALAYLNVATTRVSVSGEPGNATMTVSPLSGNSDTDITFDIKGTGGPFTLDFGDNSSPHVIDYLGNIDSDSISHKYSSLLQTDASHTYTVKLMSGGKTISTAQITIQTSGCDIATAQFLRGQITPQAWHAACGTSAIYNGNNGN